MPKLVTILTQAPVIHVLADMRIHEEGMLGMADWVKSHRSNCVLEGVSDVWSLLPHDAYDVSKDEASSEAQPGRRLTDNEVLAEIAGRKCYNSFADAAGRKTNKDYLDHIFSSDPIHSSIIYHPKMTFFFAGVSRKFSHQFIRNYVGSDRSEEGCPSQESTRFTHHYGWYVAPPYLLEGSEDDVVPKLENFRNECQRNYDHYCEFIEEEVDVYCIKHGKHPVGGAKKDIYEAAAGYLNMSAETSFVWTTNPAAIRKFLNERCHAAADAEIYRFASSLARICFSRWSNLFLGKDMDIIRARIG